MNRREAIVSLIMITYFAAIQYVFLENIPSNVSKFEFMTITNLIGFVITFILFFNELFRLDKKQILKSLILSIFLFHFNVFLLMGTKGVSATTSASVLSAYFAFVIVIQSFITRKLPKLNHVIGVIVVLLGLGLFMSFQFSDLFSTSGIWLLLTDISFAAYIVVAGKYATDTNPAILAMGQLFFNFILSLAFYIGESLINHSSFEVPKEPMFWGSVIFISIFIRGFYGIVQIYAQRYINAFYTSLIFSTEIVITVFMSPLIAMAFGTKGEEITLIKLLGSLVIVAGVLISDEAIYGRVKQLYSSKKSTEGEEEKDGN
ncbi:MAG: DMT family transporter [Lachnospiraceae bacterium]|nr:DMT family transporter [Lachnospiraceae bacterium]